MFKICARRFTLVIRYRQATFVGVRGIFGSNGSASRSFSSSRHGGSFKLDALPFSVSPETALNTFRDWAVDEQGLNYLMNWSGIRIGAAYAPVWSFDLNIRFIVKGPDGKRIMDWKPDIFKAFQNMSTVHLPGLSTYAGHNYRRSLINPVHNTTLVFMGDKTVPFGKWMLRDMKLENGAKLEVFPDPWNTTRARAFAVVQEQLEELSREYDGPTEVLIETLSARRVYMPTYVIEYSVLGMQYKAFVSGCDTGAFVSGVSHRVFNFSNQTTWKTSQNLLTQVFNAAQFSGRVLGPRNTGTAILVGLQLFGNIAARLLMRLPVISLIGGLFVGFRKIVQPWMDDRSASAEWERQRENEAFVREHADHENDFVDNGEARRYFRRNRARILRYLSGENQHDAGDFGWYKEWEEWARRQWEQQQQQQQQQEAYKRPRQEYQQRPQRKARPEYQWDFDPNDPYSVLGIQRGATRQEVSSAFRKEMLKHHPDVQGDASEAKKARAVERSKYITEAYRKIKAEMKR